MVTIKDLLKTSKDLTAIVRILKRCFLRINRNKHFKKYFKDSDRPMLQIGSEGNFLPGWLNTNFNDQPYLDATEKFPFNDDTFYFIMCEHMIEHIEFNQAKNMLAECYRTLKTGGRLRISTPDLLAYIEMLEPHNPAHTAALKEIYNSWILPGFHKAKNFRPLSEKPDPLFVLNDIFYNYEHRFIYSHTVLCELLQHTGFKHIEKCSVGKSSSPELVGIELHSDPNQVLLTIVVEAEK